MTRGRGCSLVDRHARGEVLTVVYDPCVEAPMRVILASDLTIARQTSSLLVGYEGIVVRRSDGSLAVIRSGELVEMEEANCD